MSGLRDYDVVRNWLDGFNPPTQRHYLPFLAYFCEYTGKNPDELIQWVKEDRTRVHGKVKEFYQRLAARKLAPTSRAVGYMIVRSFFKHNDFPLGGIPRYFKQVPRIKRDRLLTPREVSDMIGCAKGIRARMIISLFAQTGQRIGVLTSLRYGHIRRQIERAISPVVVEMRSGIGVEEDGELSWSNKGGHRYQFAFGKECRDYIIQMIDVRRQRGEVLDDNSPIVATESSRIPNRNWVKDNELPEGIRPMPRQRINDCVVKAAYLAGIQVSTEVGYRSDGSKKVHHEVHSHVFRAFWKHQMREAGVVDSDLLNYMMGQQPRYGGVYDKFDVEYVRKEYAKAEPMLTFMHSLPGIKPEGPTTGEAQVIQSGKPQRVVTESELNDCFAEGWRYVATLPSGRIVIG